MKKLTIAFILIIVSAGFLSAQFNSGSKMVGASSNLDFGFLSEKDEGATDATKMIFIDINPRAAYFLKNRIAVGGDLEYYLSRSKVGESDPYSSTTFRIGPFARYYYKTVASVVPFAELKGGLGSQVDKLTTGEKFKHRIIYVGAGVGASFFLADNFALEGMLNYIFENQKNKEMGGSHNTNGIMLNFGFSFYFNSLLQD
ncbi:MAG: hypothetical protein AMS27_02625 [Bacteroides sp. SM23_62_1]|nr:MAG: hypothetical protein AMS27_02625 [Bacteroides sp. SM23_62_1]